jgi:outer membrane protein assembly factor BamE (lipoprotein component of BamABCDE complex)
MLVAGFLLIFGVIAVGISRPYSRLYIDNYLYRFQIGQALVRTSTRYGQGYSESKFRQISIGTSADTLRATLGQPLAHFTNEHGGETWMYSFHQQGNTTMYWKSRIIYTSNNAVIGKLSFVNWN